MKLSERINHIIHNYLLRVDIAEHSPMRRGYRLLYYTLRGINRHRTNVDSAALTLFSLFALVPLLTLVLLILGKFGVFERYISVIYASVPNDWGFVVDSLVSTARSAADNIAPGFLAVVGIAALLVAIFNLFQTAEVSFSRVWGVTKRRRFILRYTAYFIVAVFVPRTLDPNCSAQREAMAIRAVRSVGSWEKMRIQSSRHDLMSSSVMYSLERSVTRISGSATGKKDA
jgi:membrane protein